MQFYMLQPWAHHDMKLPFIPPPPPNRDRVIRPKPDHRINKNHMTEYLVGRKLTNCKFGRILCSKQYYLVLGFFAFSIVWSFFSHPVFLALWIQSTGPAPPRQEDFFCHKIFAILKIFWQLLWFSLPLKFEHCGKKPI